VNSAYSGEDLTNSKPQHFVFGFHGYEISEDAKELIEKYHVGWAMIALLLLV